MHGTVSSAPYPGYVHGTDPRICPSGCVPSKPAPTDAASTLVREASEYQALFHAENGLPDADRIARWEEISMELAANGTYELTLPELEHGVRGEEMAQ